MNKKSLLHGIIVVLLVVVTFFILKGIICQVREKSYKVETAYSDDSGYYEKLGHVDEEDVKLPKLGEITEIVDISGLPKKNGQSNSPIMPVGAEIYPLLYGENLAMYADGEWWLLKRHEKHKR